MIDRDASTDAARENAESDAVARSWNHTRRPDRKWLVPIAL